MNKQTARLLENHFDIAFAAPDGIKKLRELILTLAMQGKLVKQNPADPPASELLKEIQSEKQRLVKQGKIKEPKPLPPIKPEEVPYELPKGWEWVRLADASARIHYGYTDSANFNTKNVRLLRITDIQDNSVNWESVPGCNATKETVSQYLLEENDILIARTGGTVGKSYLVKGVTVDAVFASYLIRITPSKHINVNFLKHFAEGPLYWRQLYAACSGTGQPNVNGTSLSQLHLPLPPLPEQHRIVAKIGQLMARCDELEKLREERDRLRLAVHAAAIRQLPEKPAGQAGQFLARHFGDLYTVKENVAELRKAILQLAVMGKLVPQNPKDPPASELLKEIEAEKQRLIKQGKIKEPKPLPPIKKEEVPYELPKGWEWVHVWDVAKLITSGSRDWAKHFTDSGAIFLTMGNLSRGSYQLRMDTIRYVSPPADGEGSRTKLEVNDLLISITGDVGNLGLIPPDFGEAYINQHTCLLRFMPNCNSRYFPELMLSPIAKKQFDAPQRGVKNSFRLGDVGEMIIPLPPLPEQHRIVAKIDQLMALCDTLDQQIDAADNKQVELLNTMMAQV